MRSDRTALVAWLRLRPRARHQKPWCCGARHPRQQV